MTIAIIGAGMAGLSCAQGLVSADKTVRVFDKGRGPGGRMSTRRTDTALGEVRWDHGAQYFTARSDAFQAAVQEWTRAGACNAWQARFATITDGAITPYTPSEPRYVGQPSMNAIIRHMAAAHHVEWGRRVADITGAAGALTLSFEDGTKEGPFEAVIVAVPAEQAAVLLATPDSQLANAAQAIKSAPCWTVMLAFDAPVAADFDAAKVTGSPLSWIARNASKPARGSADTWVLQASPEWSSANLEVEAATVATQLIDAFRQLTPMPEPVFAAAHRWRFAQVVEGAAQAAYWDSALGIGACGDWCIGGRVEAAWSSGQAMKNILVS